ncbi:MAG TPA: winged helix-turn-helix domain-containing protein [Ktedonobacteraceae bacterium]
MMKRRFVVVAVALFALVAFVGFNLLTPGTARAQTTDDCALTPTIASLATCVEHAASQGIITSQGVANSLLAELDAAQAALDRVWGYDFGGNGNVVEVYVMQLRQKLEAEGEARLIHTIRGAGYVLRKEER